MPPAQTTDTVDWRALAAAGVKAYQAGQWAEAGSAFERALQLQPRDADLVQMLGMVRLGQGKVDEALGLLEKARALKPASPVIMSNLGKAYSAAKRPDDALACYQKAIALQPDLVEAQYNVGNVLFALGRFDDSIAAFRRAISLRPALPQAHYNLGNALQELRDFSGSERAYRDAIRYKPDHFSAHSNLGTALFSQGRSEESVQSYRTALTLNPSDAEAYYSLANVLVTQHKLDEAVDLCRKGLSFQPDEPKLLGLFIFASRRMCLWENTTPIESAYMRAAGRDTFDGATFPLLSLVDDPALHFTAAKTFATHRLPAAAKVSHAPVARTRDKIRLGYCSADFGQHVMSTLFAGLFELHDRDAFEVYGISFGRDDGSEMRKRVLRAFDHVIDIQGISDAAAAEKIRALEIDIAIDMKGYTRDNRAAIFAHRAAPIQVNYVGYPGTMGVDFMDYILVDPFVAPLNQQANYGERLVQLPNCYWINDTQIAVSSKTPTRADYGLPEDAFVLCSFSNSYKITPEIFDIWMRLLGKLPDSVLWLLGDNAWAEKYLRSEAQKRGIDPARLIFGGRIELDDHVARHVLADLGIDTFPYNGHTTVSDALWMGLPVVTYTGKSFAARVAGSMLLTVDLPELITTTPADYEALILDLAQDRAKLAAIKAKLMKNKAGASLYDAKRTTRDLENAYKLMMKSLAAGGGPQPIVVP